MMTLWFRYFNSSLPAVLDNDREEEFRFINGRITGKSMEDTSWERRDVMCCDRLQ